MENWVSGDGKSLLNEHSVKIEHLAEQGEENKWNNNRKQNSYPLESVC